MHASYPRFGPHSTVAALREWILKSKTYHNERSRIHLLDRTLCDDSITAVRASLPKPHTCDIIDLNPGVCVWSEAIHDALRPRRHILVEKHRRVYGDFINSLVDRQGSHYCHAFTLDEAMSLDNKLLSEEFRAQVKKESTPQSNGRQPDAQKLDTLLITANLTAMGKQLHGYTATESKAFLGSFYRSLFSRKDYYHQYGFVKLLVWTDEKSKSSMVPASVLRQCKQSVQLEATCDVTVVASPSTYMYSNRTFSRWHELDSENIREIGEHPNPTRRPGPSRPPIGYFEPTTKVLAENRKLLPQSSQFVDQVLYVEDAVKKQNPEWLRRYEQRVAKGRKHKPPKDETENLKTVLCADSFSSKTLEQKRYRILMTRLRTYHHIFLRVAKIIQLNRELWQSLNTVFYKNSTRIKQILSDNLRSSTNYETLPGYNRAAIEKAIDDYQAFDSNPRTLAWNRRTFEPLLVHPSEYYPSNVHRAPALILFEPKPETVTAIDTIDKQICFDYVISSTTMNKHDSVVDAVKRLVPANYEQFLDQIPDLKDIRKGGWHDLRQKRMRSLHWRFHLEIALAFERWPHRPPTERLIQVGESVFDTPLR